MGSGKPFRTTSPIGSKLQEVGLADRLDHRLRHQDLPAERAGDDAVGEVDVAAEVVAVPVDRAP